MPLTSALKAWLWVQVWACVVAWVGTAVSAAPQQFPEASEDNHFVFRSDGTYSFSYDTGAGQHQSFRIETRDSKGRVSGRFGYVDPDGVLRITEYQADTEGYRANMEIYHLVSWFPRSPLLVGPLPQPPSEVEDPPDSLEAPQETTTGPVGTPLFFPPQGPILIIGPLPKPLQPPRNLLDQEPPNLTEETLVGAPLDTVLPPPSDFLQASAIEDISESSPREILQDGIVNALLQGSLEDILQESVTDLLSSSIPNTSLAISNNTQQNTELPSESPPTTVDDDDQDLPEGLEQTDLWSEMQDSGLTNPPSSVLPDEGSRSRSSPGNVTDISSTIAPEESASNRTLNVFEQVLPERFPNTSAQERQDNFKNSNISITGTTSTSITGTTSTSITSSLTSTTISATTSTTASPISTVSGTTTRTLPRVNKEITMTSQLTTSARPRLTTLASPQLKTSARPQPTITRVPQSTSSMRPQQTSAATLQLTASVRGPELTTTNTPSVATTTLSRASPTPVGRPLSATASTEHGDLKSGQEGDTSPSATFIKTFPPVPALTYLPVGEERYDTPPDVYSYLPQTFNPFF
ncbi:uncharacterized protein [Panulirus ornatus]|uniref:uncharacterized protein isoform X2 n=1 Tax=Panulirus ornatus TaxID=150431 RepID=UPI003A885C2F